MTCTKSKITLDATALDRLINDPEGVLADPEAFWSGYRAQALSRRWAEVVGVDIDYAAWRNQVEAWARLPLEERREHLLVRNYEAIRAAQESIHELALPHICAFMPPGADLSATIRFGTFLPARAFAIEDIVFNIAAPYWRGNPSNILNQIVHEIGHVGYGYCREVGRPDEHPDKAVAGVLGMVQNEGLCSYIAYTAQHIYPAPDDVDFHLADDPGAVERLFADVDEILAGTQTLAEPELDKLIWDKGVMDRAAYIVGLRMCELIDRRLGRQALIQSLLDGPSAFTRVYNGIAPADRLVAARFLD